jgi:hypothetical protein
LHGLLAMSGSNPPAETATLPRLAAGSTGGLRWHWRAFASRRRWAGTRQVIARWLDSCPAAEAERLLLVGASAGWMMPSGWLARFREIEAFDLDPLAAPFFALRHGRTLRARQTRWRFHRRDAFEDLEMILARWPQATVLFDNMLGQLRYRYQDGESLERRLSELSGRLDGRLWGSIHDWLSGPVLPGAADPAAMPFEMRALEAGARAPAGAAARRAPGPMGQEPSVPVHEFPGWLLARWGARGVWQDHLTGAVFPLAVRGVLIPWPFSGTHAHWLQAAWIDARLKTAA